MLWLYPILAGATLIMGKMEEFGERITSYQEDMVTINGKVFSLHDDGLKVPAMTPDTFFIQFREGQLQFPNSPNDHDLSNDLEVQEGDSFYWLEFEDAPPRSFLDALYRDRLSERGILDSCGEVYCQVRFKIIRKQTFLEHARIKFTSMKVTLIVAFFVLILLAFLATVISVLTVKSSPGPYEKCKDPLMQEVFYVEIGDRRNDSFVHPFLLEIPRSCEPRSFDWELYKQPTLNCLKHMRPDIPGEDLVILNNEDNPVLEKNIPPEALCPLAWQ